MTEKIDDMTISMTDEQLAANHMKKVVCTRCHVVGVFAEMVPVPDDYECMECGTLRMAADEVGVLVVWDEESA